MKTPTKDMTNFKADVLKEAIDKTGLPMHKLSAIVLQREASYISKGCNKGNMAIGDLTKLCEFLGVDFDSVIIKEEPKPEEARPHIDMKVPPIDTKQLDTIVFGLNQLYQAQTETNRLISELLTELRATNTKLNRHENALGQIASSELSIKESVTKDMLSLVRDTKSSVAIISGRTKDILNNQNALKRL